MATNVYQGIGLILLDFFYLAVYSFHGFFIYLLKVKIHLTFTRIFKFCSFVENQFFSVCRFFFSWNLFILTGDEDFNRRLSTEYFSEEKQTAQYTWEFDWKF